MIIALRLTVHCSSQTANKTQKFAANVCGIPCSKVPVRAQHGSILQTWEVVTRVSSIKNLIALASNLRAMASNLLAMASNLLLYILCVHHILEMSCRTAVRKVLLVDELMEAFLEHSLRMQVENGSCSGAEFLHGWYGDIVCRSPDSLPGCCFSRND